MGVRLVVVATLAACSTQPSRLDHAFDNAKQPTADPWSAKSEGAKHDDDDKSFDLQGTLAKIADAIDKPGPYEAKDASADYAADKPHWGVLALGGGVVEREAFSFTGGRGTELHQLDDRLRALAKEDKLTGVLLRVGGVEISMPDLVELRAAMHDLRAAGKRLVCHADNAVNASYLLLAACDRIALAPLGEVVISGPAAMPVHIKGLLDKLGVQADFIHVGEYKGAAEPLTRDAPSKEMEETIGAILDRRYQTMVDEIAGDRHLEPAAVKGLIDTAIFPAADAQGKGLVDEVAPFEAVRDALHAPWHKLELDPAKKDRLQTMVKLARFIGAMPPERPLGDHVALIYAIGNIVDGGGGGVLGAREEIAGRTLIAALRAIANDASVKAVVMRVDSGGGSAQASELIWNAVQELKAKKPVIVSMSDVAASGGYYISAGATKIFALDDTLTGSIGVVGGKIAPAGALAKIGVATFPIGRGKRATMMASLSPWTEEQKQVIETTMKAVYTTFVARVAAGRGKKPEDIEPIAKGRVWTGAKAKELGLVDEIGGLDAAIAEARKLAKVDPATELEVYPPSPTLRDVLHGFGQVQSPLGLRAELDAELRMLDTRVADAAEHLVDLVLSFQHTNIQTLAVLPVLP